MSSRTAVADLGRGLAVKLKKVGGAATSRQSLETAGLVLALLSASTLFGALLLLMPLQYRFLVSDAVARRAPFFYALATITLFSLLLLWSLRSRGRLDMLLGSLALAPTLILLVTASMVTGLSATLAIAWLVALAILGAAFWLLRREALIRKTPDILRSVWTGLAVAAVIYFSAGIASGVSPVTLPRSAGSLAIIAVFSGFAAVLLTTAVLRPVFGVCLLIYGLLALALFGPNDHRISPIATGQSMAGPFAKRPDIQTHDLDMVFVDWLLRRADLSAYRNAARPYPVIFVSSEGGGIYAAAHAYGALSTFAAHCPTFSQHVFATVGVSGGALGNALFAASLDPQQHYYAPCGGEGRKVDAGAFALDHLSPVLARFLLVEPVDRMLPGQWMKGDRAQMLADSFLQSAEDKAYLEQPVGESFDPSGARPALISVAVDVGNGRRFVMSPFNPREYGGTGRWWPGRNPFTEEEEAGPEISVIDAAGLSARFPWITPTGRLTISDKKDIILADGGYFDNSGADTVLDLVNALRMRNAWTSNDDEGESEMPLLNDRNECAQERVRIVRAFHPRVEWKPCEVVVFIIHFALASSEPGAAAPQHQSFLLDPLKALMATRTSRGEIALARADLDLCGTFYSGAECLADPHASMGFFRDNIAPREMGLPLGWYMPRSSFDRMTREAVPVELFDYHRTRKEGSSDLEFLMYHLDPGLYAPGASPSLDDLMPDP